MRVCVIVMDVQGSVARCVEGVCVWRKCVGDERGHQRPRYLQVCQGQKYVVFVCFSVLTMCYVCLRAFTGRVAVPRCVVGYESSALSEGVTCEAVEGSGHAGNGRYLCFHMCILHMW